MLTSFSIWHVSGWKRRKQSKDEVVDNDQGGNDQVKREQDNLRQSSFIQTAAFSKKYAREKKTQLSILLISLVSKTRYKRLCLKTYP